MTLYKILVEYHTAIPGKRMKTWLHAFGTTEEVEKLVRNRFGKGRSRIIEWHTVTDPVLFTGR